MAGRRDAAAPRPGASLLDVRARRLATGLAFVAGYVDAIGFVETGGFFVSFMSGNTTRMGVGLAEAPAGAALLAGLLMLFFTGGVTLGALAGGIRPERRGAIVLTLAAALLLAAAALGAAGARTAAVLCLALAMGAKNTVFLENGEVRIALTYMTGTLVRIGHGVAAALRGGDPLGWLPPLVVWLGFLLGAVAGALAHGRLGGGALWAAAAATALFGALMAAGPPGPEAR